MKAIAACRPGVLSLAWLLWAGAGQAQTAPAEAAGDPDDAQRGVLTVPAEPAGEAARGLQGPVLEFDRQPVLPALPEGRAGAWLGEAPRVQVRSLVLEGGTVLTPEEVALVTRPYEGRAVSAEELDAVRNRLSLLYFDRGYVNSGVVLPDQSVEAGVIAYREVLGRVTEVRLDGHRALDERWWRERVGRATAGPLQINALQAQLQVLEQEPLVQRIEARLTPGLAPGESVLDLKVYETRPWRLEIGIDNHRSPSLGGEQLTVRAAHLSLSGRGDRLEAHGKLADGLGDGGLSYTLPLDPLGSTLRAYYAGGDADITEAPFDIVNIQSRTYSAGLELTRPFRRSPNRSLSGFLGLEVRHSESSLLGMPFSFSLGEIAGEADTSAARAGLTWTHRDPRQVVALQASLRYGADWFRAAVNPVVPPGLRGPDTEFLVLSGQGQYVRRLGWRESEWHLRGAFQLAGEPLLPVEKMPVGGAWSVRGYRENLLVRDNGLSASLEFRLPLFAGRERAEGFDPRALTALAFTDFGQSWDQNTGLPSDRKTRLWSVGLGLMWSPLPKLSLQLFRGEALEDVPGRGDDPQDEGWHWRLAWRVF